MNKIMAFILGFIISLSAVAATEPADSTSSAQSETFLSAVKKKVRLTYSGQFFGPSIGKPTEQQPTQFSNTGGDYVSLYNSVGLGYKITDTWTAGVNPRWLWYPVKGAQNDLELLNPRVFVTKANVVKTSTFKAKANVNSELPATTNSRKSGLIAAPALVLAGDYTPTDSRWGFGATTFARGYFYTKSGAGKNVLAYIGPNVSYKLSPKLSANVLYELAAIHPRGKAATEWQSDGSWIQPGVVWDITENVNLYPYIQLYPSGKVSLETSSVGFYLTGTIL